MATTDTTQHEESLGISTERSDSPKRRYTYTFSTQPLETDLKKLLVQVTGRTNLRTISEVKMKVVTSQAGLHRLSSYTPQLKILMLDGSCVSSLRDLGSCLKSLTTLSVVRCNLKTLDGIWGFRDLKELLARDNFIINPSPCSGARKLVKLDLRNNDISDVTYFLFLQACKNLRCLSVAGNKFEEYRDVIRTFLPRVRVLDGQQVEITEGDVSTDDGSSDEMDLTNSEDDSLLSFLNDTDVNEMGDPRGYVQNDSKDSTDNRSNSDLFSSPHDSNPNDDEPSEASRSETDSRIKLEVGDTTLNVPIDVLPEESAAISGLDIAATTIDKYIVHDVPSKLMTGRVICGNLAASLRPRNPARNVFTLPQIRSEVKVEEPK